jgi:asparagine synthetase B (glutamine-hydrolysing)
MVLSGEGSDEMFGGYLYFHKVTLPVLKPTFRLPLLSSLRLTCRLVSPAVLLIVVPFGCRDAEGDREEAERTL